MKKYIRELTASIIERLGSSADTKDQDADGRRFLLEEGIDVLASLKTIEDQETRLLLKRLIDAVSRERAASAKLKKSDCVEHQRSGRPTWEGDRRLYRGQVCG